MAELRALSEDDLVRLLTRAQGERSSASLRADGTVRMLGNLHVEGLEQGVAIRLLGAKQRDNLCPEGTPVTLSLIMGEEAVAIPTRILEGAEAGAEGQPLVRVAWPDRPLEFHRRDEVRVATLDAPSLGATLIYRGRSYAARMLNLTEMGMGLELGEEVTLALQDQVTVESILPGGAPFRATGQVRHWQILEGDGMPTRVGLILESLPAETRDALRRLIQARRMYYSQDIREGLD